MIYDPTRKPLLRPIEAAPADGNGDMVAVYDRTGLSGVSLKMSRPALLILQLMDGQRSCDQILSEFERTCQQTLAPETLAKMIGHLDEAHLLHGPAFDAFYEDQLAAYRAAGVRPMPHAEALGIDASGTCYEQMLADAPLGDGRHVAAVIAPHLDYPRGKPCYAWAYGALRHRPTPQRIVVLGTNHSGLGPWVVATTNAFETPIGRTEVDVDMVAELESRCGDLRTSELDHLHEHSVELQVGWLQHLFGATSFSLVPVLCHDPCMESAQGEGAVLHTFAEALGAVLAEDDDDTLLVAGADLSHVGAAFGDMRYLDESRLAEVRAHDETALDHLVDGGGASFLSYLADTENHTSVCSAGCMYALATATGIAFPDARPRRHMYHQAVDESSQTCVTCTAITYA